MHDDVDSYAWMLAGGTPEALYPCGGNRWRGVMHDARAQINGLPGRHAWRPSTDHHHPPKG